MKVGIIEDEIPARKQLISLLRKIDSGIGVAFEAESIKSSVSALKMHPKVDLIFMDIQLNDGLSFEIFDEFQVSVPVIFTTAFDQFMMEAFQKNGIDYILKPIKRKELETSLEKYFNLQNHFNQFDLTKLKAVFDSRTYRDRWVVKKGITFSSLSTDEIAYFYSEHKVSFLVTKKVETHLIEGTLAEIEAELDPSTFFRLNRKHIASFEAIKEFKSAENGKLSIRLIPPFKEYIYVSQEKSRDFKAWLGAK